jgi:hypothetical protein
MPIAQRVTERAPHVFAIWGTALLCAALLDWIGYGRFITSLFYR